MEKDMNFFEIAYMNAQRIFIKNSTEIKKKSAKKKRKKKKDVDMKITSKPISIYQFTKSSYTNREKAFIRVFCSYVTPHTVTL